MISPRARDTDPELFFPIGTAGPALHQEARAKQICAGCQVRTACLRWALASGQEVGVWGVTSEDERRTIRLRLSLSLDEAATRLPAASSIVSLPYPE